MAFKTGTKGGPSASAPIKAKEMHMMNNRDVKIARVTIVVPRSGTIILFASGGSSV